MLRNSLVSLTAMALIVGVGLADDPVEIRSLEGHQATAAMVAFSPDGRTLASCSEDGTAIIWDWKDGKQLKTLQGHTGGVVYVAWSPHGKTIVTSGRDNSAILWDVVSGEKRTTLEHTTGVSCSIFSPDGKHLVTMEDKTVMVRKADGELHAKLEGHEQPVIVVAYSPEGTKLVSAGGDWNDAEKHGEIKLWDMKTHKQIEFPRSQHRYGPVWGATFSPDGKVIAAACLDGKIHLWDVETGKHRAEFKGHTDRVIWVAFSPNGRTLASSSLDGTVRMWDPETGKERAVLKPATAPQRLAFAPDGKHLAVACDGGPVHIWKLNK